LLEQTSELVSLFNDKLYISSVHDKRLKKLEKFHELMKIWANQTEGKSHLFVSSKLWFGSLVSIKLSHFPQSVVKPAIINQDCVENHFGQVRSCNGQNNNPTYLQQQSTQNSIRIGQTFISRKSNAGKSSTGTIKEYVLQYHRIIQYIIWYSTLELEHIDQLIGNYLALLMTNSLR
jgi:hypothetical protein